VGRRRMGGAPMGRWFRGNHVLCWATIGVAAVAVAVASVLPGIRLAIGAYIGAGSTQRAFRYERDVSFAGELRPWGLLPLAVGLLLLAAAVLGILRREQLRGPRSCRLGAVVARDA